MQKKKVKKIRCQKIGGFKVDTNGFWKSKMEINCRKYETTQCNKTHSFKDCNHQISLTKTNIDLF